MDSFGFGLIYYDENGTATGQYYENVSTDYNVQFSLNMIGIGLPSITFDTLENLMEDIFNKTVTCDNNGGTQNFCTLPKTCDQY